MKEQAEHTETKSSRLGYSFNRNDTKNELNSIGPFYTYVLDRSQQTISKLSPSFETLHGLSSQTFATATKYATLIHPEDLVLASNFEVQANTLFSELDPVKISRYKLSYNIRLWTANQTFQPFNIQRIVYELDLKLN